MQMLSRACFGLPHVREFQWSPAGSVLAYVIPEIGGKPATVVLLDVSTDRRVQSVSTDRRVQSVSFTNVEDVGEFHR